MPQVDGELLVRAIRAYLELAYPSGEVAANRRHFAQIADGAAADIVLGMKGVERLPPSSPDEPCGYALRVGCQWYSHTKIVLRTTGADGPYLFFVDTHDELIVPAGEKEEEAVRQLKQRNLELARGVERKWTALGLPTQEGVLRDYLARSRPRGANTVE